jgi:hypothetical protein
VRPDPHSRSDGGLDGGSHRPRVAGVPAAGDVGTAQHPHEVEVVVDLAEIGIEVDCRGTHVPILPAARLGLDGIEEVIQPVHS